MPCGESQHFLEWQWVAQPLRLLQGSGWGFLFGGVHKVQTWLISEPQDEPRCQLLSSPRLSQETSHANTDRDPSVLHIWSRDLNELNPTITFRPRLLSFLGALTMGSDRLLWTIRAFPHSCPNERPELSDSVDSSSEAWQKPLTWMPAKLALGPQDESVESLVTMSQATSG